MTTAYTTRLPHPEGLPAHLTVRVVVMHRSGAELTRAELAAAAALYPPAVKDRASLERALALAPEARAKPTSGAAKPPKPSKRGSSAKAAATASKAPKRAVAKRPSK